MKSRKIIESFLARFLILGFNFGLLIFTTNFWGTEGKGIISLVIADLAIIGFFSNIFTGSSVSYYFSKFQPEQVVVRAYIWSLISGTVFPILLSLLHPIDYLNHLIGLSVSFSLLTTNIQLFVGRQEIGKFNLYSVLQQAVHFVVMLVLIYVFQQKSVETYLLALIICYVLLVITSSIYLLKDFKFSNISLSPNIFQNLFSYGWKSQLSAFLQFLNNRASFYFLEFFRGVSSVGIFGVGVAFSEAIWTVSRSLSVILYSDIVSQDEAGDAIQKTKISLRISFLVSFLFILLILLIPGSLYAAILGEDFGGTRMIILLLSPGILAIAVSNIIGHYFAGVNELKILNIKSVVGLVFTVLASFVAIPRWGILGACIVTSISYLLSSGILFWRFYRVTHFEISDFMLTKNEMQLLLNKIRLRNSAS